MSHRRALLWIGLALALAAPLLDLGALFFVFADRALPETPALRFAGRIAQVIVFAAALVVLRSRRPEGRPFPLCRLWGAAAALLGMEAAALLFAATTGAIALLAAGAAVGLLLLALHGAVALLNDTLGGHRRLPGVAGPLLAVATLAAGAVVAETLLAALARRAPPAAAPGAPRLVMPDALARRETTVAGACSAWWWQGQLHLFDDDGFRRATPLPPKTLGTFRVIAVGDSLTYGYGVAAEEAWPALLQRTLGEQYRVEVLNLGVCGAQSEEVLGVLERLLPRVEPDLVLYGVCLNDFLPAGRGEYANNRAWRVSFPGSFHLDAATRVGALVADGYDRLLMRAGVRADFMADILRDFGSYQRRFARDAAAMNRAVTSRGLPPIVALVLNQVPATHGPVWEVAAIAERLLREAGMAVIAADYLRRHEGRVLTVNRWEAHPNAEAHRIFAEEFVRAVRRDSRLATHRRAEASAVPLR